MIKYVVALALACSVSVTAVSAQEIQPRFEKLLISFEAQKDKKCPYLFHEYGMGDMVPAVSLRKNKDLTTEFIKVRYYPMYGLVSWSVRTAGGRFENKCREAAVAVLAKSGTVDGGAFVGCPGRDYGDFVEPYGIGKDGKPTSDQFKKVWQKRADEFLNEAESIVALCK